MEEKTSSAKPAFDWQSAMDEMKKYVFQIQTPSTTGTGFLVASTEQDGVIGIATAFHVIKDVYEWGQPLKLTHYSSGVTALLKEGDRSIHPFEKSDCALIRLANTHLKVSSETPELMKAGFFKGVGVEVGWCGFPAVYPSAVCFFSGRISAYLSEQGAYLVDGVAINGVSGGPVFGMYSDVIGLVTAYIPNRATGEPLPGVSLIRSIEPLVKFFKEREDEPPKAADDTKINEPRTSASEPAGR
ncbi:MAG: trypsin-like peptidase domain-containing protein [Planctomycetes bacterium]|nr:trypsin-like peptidase domain-containing protein [Planctomycetota bacterium]